MGHSCFLKHPWLIFGFGQTKQQLSKVNVKSDDTLSKSMLKKVLASIQRKDKTFPVKAETQHFSVVVKFLGKLDVNTLKRIICKAVYTFLVFPELLFK